MRLRNLMAGVAVSSLIGVGSAAASTYYVGPDGSDSNDGMSSATPFANFSFAFYKMQPGDTLLILPGTYDTATNNLSISLNGSPTAYTWVRAATSTRPVLMSSTGVGSGVYITGSYVKVAGLDVSTGQESTYPAFTINGANHVNVSGCLAHDSGGGGLSVTRSDYITLFGNAVWDNAYASPNQDSGISLGFGVNSDTLPGVHNLIAGNVSYGNFNKVPVASGSQAGYTTDGNGIVVDSMNNTGVPNGVPFVGQTVIENNIVFNNGGRGIAIFQSDNVIVVNNTASNDLLDPQFNPAKQAAEFSAHSTQNTVFYNNIANVTGISPVHYAFMDVASSGGDVFDYNLGYGGNLSYLFNYLSPAVTLGPNTILGQSPLFAPGQFFRLQAGSPALAAGTTTDAPSTDRRGTIRYATGPIDMGAYQQNP